MTNYSSGLYPTSMLTTNTGTQNAIALTADITAAAGKQIIIPPGSYTLNAVTTSSGTANIRMMPGGTLVPDSGGGLYLSGIMLHFTNTTVRLYDMNINGNKNGAPIMVRADGGTFYAWNTTMTTVGVFSGSSSTTGVYGFELKSCTDVRIDGWYGSGFDDQPNGTYGDAPGTVRHIFLYNVQSWHVTNAKFIADSNSVSAEDFDFFQTLDDQGAGNITVNGTMDNADFRYNDVVRRCIKIQGGYNTFSNIDIRKDASFVGVQNSVAITGAASHGGLIQLTVNTTNIITGNTVVVAGVTGTTEANGTWVVTVIDGTHMDLQASTFTNAYVSGGTAAAQTNAGTNCLNCVDYAGSVDGWFEMTDSYIDATGYDVGVTHTVGPLGTIVLKNSKLIGSTLNSIRVKRDTGLAENTGALGFYTVNSTSLNALEGCTVKGFATACAPAGNHETILNNVFDDPRDLWLQAGGSTASQGVIVANNTIITRTPGYLGTTRTARLDNIANVSVFGNHLVEDGNTTHANLFIAITNTSATGTAYWNVCDCPGLATTPFTAGASAVVNVSPAFTGTTGAGNAVLSASPTLTGTFLAASGTINGTLYINGGVVQETVYANGNSGTSMALAGNNGNLQSVTISGAVTFTYTTPTHPCRFTIVVTQDGSGHVYAMPAATKWIGGTTPAYSTAAGKIDIFTIVYDGTNYYGTSGIAFA